jgi:hypothetical protein
MPDQGADSLGIWRVMEGEGSERQSATKRARLTINDAAAMALKRRGDGRGARAGTGR